jgi:hypothetical protein
MANFELQKNNLEGILNTQLNATRQTQGVWEWFNALYRIISASRFGGTTTIYGAKQLSAGANVVETVPVSLFGVLVDNSQAAEDLYLAVSNVASTPGTTDTLSYFWVPRASLRTFAIPEPTVFTARLEVFSVLGTEAGLEAGTASTTQPTVVLVYTK